MNQLHAIIGMWQRDQKIYFVQRSASMENYPSVWSLMSLQHEKDRLDDPRNLKSAARIFNELSESRFDGEPIEVHAHVLSQSADNSFINSTTHLHLYQISFDEEPTLNDAYYTNAKWLTFDEYLKISKGTPCGLCTCMLEDHLLSQGIILNRVLHQRFQETLKR